MAKYEVTIQPQAWKDIDRIPKKDAYRVHSRLGLLGNDLSGDIKKLKQHQPQYRLRVGDYRILFDLVGNRVIVYRVLNRREAYD